MQQVEPKAFRVLLMLLRNPNKLIAKEELLTGVWGDTAVTENSLTRNIALLRRLLGDDPREPRFIETVSGVGYRFLCSVEVSQETIGNGDTVPSEDLQFPNGHHSPSGLGEILCFADPLQVLGLPRRSRSPPYRPQDGH